MQKTNQKTAVITGAGRGIGRGIALHAARLGMNVVLAGIGLESLTNTAADIDQLGVQTLIVQTDVSRPDAVEQLAEKSYDHFGRVDLLVNNAGVAVPGSLLDATLDDWQWVMGVNFYGVLYGIREFVPRMMAQEHGSRIVNVSSLSGVLPGGGSYGVSKHAVLVLSESLYFELAQREANVRVSVFCPGWVASEFYRVDQSRPARFQTAASTISEQQRAGWREAIERGISIEDAAQILFDGISADKFYIGPQAFTEQVPTLPDVVRQRAENIINEQSPQLPQ